MSVACRLSSVVFDSRRSPSESRYFVAEVCMHKNDRRASRKMRLSRIYHFGSFVASVRAFAPCFHQLSTKALVTWSGRSDTSDDGNGQDEVLTVASEDFVPSETENTVTKLLDLVPSVVGEVSESRRAIINEVILKLEALNPTKQPAKSSLVNGVWELRYAAGYTSDWAISSPTRQLALFLYSGGYSPGLFALSLANNIPSNIVSIQDLGISINREQPRVQATVDIKSPLGNSIVMVKAELEVESDVRLRETYESTSVMGRTFEFPENFRYSRTLYVTYVDDDILIIRDCSGVPELLVRKEKDFSNNWRTEPSEFDEL